MSQTFLLTRAGLPLAFFSNRKACYDTIKNNFLSLGIHRPVTYQTFCNELRQHNSYRFEAPTGHSLVVYHRMVHRHEIPAPELLTIL